MKDKLQSSDFATRTNGFGSLHVRARTENVDLDAAYMYAEGAYKRLSAYMYSARAREGRPIQIVRNPRFLKSIVDRLNLSL